LLGIRYKVIDAVMSLGADFGRGNIQQKAASASKSAVFSLLLSLHKQRKEHGQNVFDSSFCEQEFRMTKQ
jgi:hypothetical protein